MRTKSNSGKLQIQGSVIYYRRFRSRFLDKERDVIVWLPPSYKRDKSKYYPVLYMHDGQNILDPTTSYAGYDWRVDETVSKLIRYQEINEVLIVGIYNTPDRLEEYSESEKGNNYLRFIVEELKHFIDSNFRTISDRENSAIMGSSLGGLCSLRMVWKYPHIFSKGACLSSSFYYGENYAFKMIEEYKGQKKNIKIYLDSGEDGKRDAQKMYCLLSSKGYEIGENLDYYYDRGAGHTESAWANRLDRPLKYFFGK
ncbi:MAG: alpha/beta hydrolase [Ignavibacteriaceae bacterium]|nr:alpha/beta hydrolase [Ignavibacteriaceae bacterium]